MKDMKKEVSVSLTSVVQYHSGGELKTATMVSLKAPTMKSLKHAAAMKQGFFQAMSAVKSDSVETKTSGDDDGEMNGEAVLALLYMSDIDIDAFFNAARELMKSGSAKLDDQVDLNDTLLNQLSVEDFEKLVGEFLVNFTLASTLMKMKSSD